MKLRSLLTLVLCCLLLASCSPLAPSPTWDTEALLPQESTVQSPASTAKAPASTTKAPASTADPTKAPAPSSSWAKQEEAFVLPAYEGKPYTAIGDNTPVFSSLTTKAYESYPPLDSLGRCQSVQACLGRELMPSEDRGSIGMVKPSGWQTAKYDFVDGKYLYNRCHLIGFQLAGENANENNLITGTRSMNVKGMLPFENMIADYVKETHNHVMYRVTPVFVGTELVARGVRMEAYSVEDEGEGICFDVFAFNVEPGVEIDYKDGSNRAADTPAPTTVAPTKPVPTTVAPTKPVPTTVAPTKPVPTTVAPTKPAPTTVAPTKPAPTTVAPTKPVPTVSPTEAPSEHTGDYLLNTSTKKIHHPDCSAVKRMSEKNKKSYSGTLSSLFSQGYDTCGLCF